MIKVSKTKTHDNKMHLVRACIRLGAEIQHGSCKHTSALEIQCIEIQALFMQCM